MIVGSEYAGLDGVSFADFSDWDSHVSSGSAPFCHARVTASARNAPSHPWKYPAMVGSMPTASATVSNSAQLNGDCGVYSPNRRVVGASSSENGGVVGRAAGAADGEAGCAGTAAAAWPFASARS